MNHACFAIRETEIISGPGDGAVCCGPNMAHCPNFEDQCCLLDGHYGFILVVPRMPGVVYFQMKTLPVMTGSFTWASSVRFGATMVQSV